MNKQMPLQINIIEPNIVENMQANIIIDVKTIYLNE